MALSALDCAWTILAELWSASVDGVPVVSVIVFEVVVVAVIAPIFLRRFICRPFSSSEEVRSVSVSEVGGGVAARFLAVDFVARFLKVTGGTVVVVSAILKGVCWESVVFHGWRLRGVVVSVFCDSEMRSILGCC